MLKFDQEFQQKSFTGAQMKQPGDGELKEG